MSPKPRLDLRRLLAVVLCGIVLLPACLRAPRAGVGVKALAADLIFGIPPVAEPVTPPNTSSTPAEPLGVVSTDESRPTLTRPSTPPPPKEECPEADATEFPDEEAATSIERAPFAGRYKWVVEGTQEVPQLGTYDLSARKHSRQIQNVTYDAATFFFETVEDEVVFGSTTRVTSRWHVRPTEGIYLVRLTHERPNSPPATFRPNPAVLYLPLPVRIGTSITSVGVDPISQEVLEHNGQVMPRQHVDACGELVDSWLVDADQRFTSAEGIDTRNYDYGIATQLGGFIVWEHVETGDESLNFTAHLGQTIPGV